MPNHQHDYTVIFFIFYYYDHDDLREKAIVDIDYYFLCANQCQYRNVKLISNAHNSYIQSELLVLI